MCESSLRRCIRMLHLSLGRKRLGRILPTWQRDAVMHRVGVKVDFHAILTPAWWWWLSES